MSSDRSGRMRILSKVLTPCLIFILLAGCGRVKYDVTTYEFAKDGHITEHIVEEFPEDIYDAGDWEKEIRADIAGYKGDGNKSIELKDIECRDGVLRCSVVYEDDDAYFYLNEQPFFYGTIAQALKAGYSLLTPVYGAEDGDRLPGKELQGMTDKHIVVMNGAPKEEIGLKVYSDILYATENVSIGDKRREARITNDNTCYIVFD